MHAFSTCLPVRACRVFLLYGLVHEPFDFMFRYVFNSIKSIGCNSCWSRITVANQVEDIPLDWALGAFILQTTAYLDAEHPNWIATVISEDSPTLISLIAIFAILMFTAWSISKWRKPQLKTIYDLEKGRYIVTRVGRYR